MSTATYRVIRNGKALPVTLAMRDAARLASRLRVLFPGDDVQVVPRRISQCEGCYSPLGAYEGGGVHHFIDQIVWFPCSVHAG